MLLSMPKFLRVIFFSQLFERIGYYGVRALLVLFLIKNFHYSDANAYVIFSLFISFSYFGPVFSGILADKFFGLKKMVIAGGIIITLGQLVISFYANDVRYFLFGVALLVLGTGYFKSNINSLIGLCYEQNKEEAVKGYTFAHIGVNIGAALASIICGYVAYFYGFRIAFFISAFGIIISMIIFLSNIRVFDHVETEMMHIKRKRVIGLSIFEIFIGLSILGAFGIAYLFLAQSFHKSFFNYMGVLIFGMFALFLLKADNKKNLICLMIFILSMMVFFVFENQFNCLLVMFLERNVDKVVFGKIVPSVVGQAINPIAIVILGSVIAGINIKRMPLLKVFIGMLMISLSFYCLYLGCYFANDYKIAYLYCVAAIAMQSIGELSVWPFVQAHISILSPKNLIGFMMGFLMFTLSFSNIFVLYLNDWSGISNLALQMSAADSLKLYQKAFSLIALLNLAIVVCFVPLFIWSGKVLKNALENKKD